MKSPVQSLEDLADSIDRNNDLMHQAAEQLRTLKAENALLKARLRLVDVQYARASDPVEGYVSLFHRQQAG